MKISRRLRTGSSNKASATSILGLRFLGSSIPFVTSFPPVKLSNSGPEQLTTNLKAVKETKLLSPTSSVISPNAFVVQLIVSRLKMVISPQWVLISPFSFPRLRSSSRLKRYQSSCYTDAPTPEHPHSLLRAFPHRSSTASGISLFELRLVQPRKSQDFIKSSQRVESRMWFSGFEVRLGIGERRFLGWSGIF
ncbi:hypothetical protein B0J14DRAFT_592829 [Halenospora varia]|nr:hypothetical protein B0J14DRAFT_592829 [Halenospora varia]